MHEHKWSNQGAAAEVDAIGEQQLKQEDQAKLLVRAIFAVLGSLRQFPLRFAFIYTNQRSQNGENLGMSLIYGLRIIYK